MAKNRAISLIIPSVSKAVKLKPLLDSVLSQDLDSDQFEVIICFNGREDLQPDERHILDHYQEKLSLTPLWEKQPGVNQARNLGASKAQAPFVYFIDDDCFFSRKDQLNHLLKLFKNSPKQVIGGPYLIGGNSPIDDFYNRMCNLWVESHKDANGEYHYLLGGNFAMSKKLFDTFKFDENFLWGGEESEFFLRLKEAEVQVEFTSSLAVYHNPGKSKRTLLETARRQGRGRSQLKSAPYNRDWLHFIGELQLGDLKKLPLGSRYAYEVFRSYLRERLRVSNPFFNSK